MTWKKKHQMHKNKKLKECTHTEEDNKKVRKHKTTKMTKKEMVT